MQAAQLLRARRQQEADAAEQALYNSNPYADYWAPQSTLPPPPGMIAAQQAWNQRAADCSISMMQGTRGHACDSSASSSTGLGALKMLSSGTMAGIGADGIQSGEPEEPITVFVDQTGYITHVLSDFSQLLCLPSSVCLRRYAFLTKSSAYRWQCQCADHRYSRIVSHVPCMCCRSWCGVNTSACRHGLYPQRCGADTPTTTNQE